MNTLPDTDQTPDRQPRTAQDVWDSIQKDLTDAKVPPEVLIGVLIRLKELNQMQHEAAKAQHATIPYDDSCKLVAAEGGRMFDVVRGNGDVFTSFDADAIRLAYREIKR